MLTGILAEAIPGAVTKETKYQAIPCIYLSFKHGWHDLHAIRAGGELVPFKTHAHTSKSFKRLLEGHSKCINKRDRGSENNAN
jgi:hypothetical protein